YVADGKLLAAKKLLLQHLIQPLHETDARAVDARRKCRQLLVPGPKRLGDLIHRSLIVPRRLEQCVLLLDDAVVIGYDLHKRRMERHDRGVKEPPPRFGLSADYLKPVSVKNNGMKLAEIPLDGLFLAVD